MPITYGEVFSGIGSAVAAWKPLGWVNKYYVENNATSYAQYLYNWNSRFRSYIDSINPKPSTSKVLQIAKKWIDPLHKKNAYRISRLPNADVMITSPPCTSFTKGGDQTGLDEETGDLFFEAHRLIRTNTPKIFILENVPNMLKIQEELVYDQLLYPHLTSPRNTFYEIIAPSLGEVKYAFGTTPGPNKKHSVKVWRKRNKEIVILEGLPYNLYIHLLDPIHFGIPMRRNRIFIVGIRTDIDNNRFAFPDTATIRNSIYDYVSPDRPESEDFRFMTYKPGTFAHGEAVKSRYKIFTGGPEQLASTFQKSPLRPRRLSIVTNRGEYRSFADEQRRSLMGFPEGFSSSIVSKTNAFKNFGNAISVDVLRLIGEQIEVSGVLNESTEYGFW